MNHGRHWTVLLVIAIAGAIPCLQGETQTQTQPPAAWYQRGWSDLQNTWLSNQWDLYLPFYEWHNRAMYGSDVRRYNYNENAWGLGIGKSHINTRGNRCSLYAIAFLDSFRKIEPQAGLMWQKIWRDKTDAWRLTLGLSAGLTARSDLYNYAPFPYVLPVLGVEYRRITLECTYIPSLTWLHVNERGNILLLWSRLRL